jgi:hypothetical protein
MNVGICLLKERLTNGYVYRGSSSNTTEATSSLFISNAGLIGIGTTTPSRKLSITDTVANPQIMVSYDSTRYATVQVDSTGDIFFANTTNPTTLTNNFRINEGDLYICSGGACPTGSVTGNGSLIVESKIGIGTSTPTRGLHLHGVSAVSNEVTDTDGATITVDWSTGNQHRVTLGGNRVIAFSNIISGQVLRFVICQDATGSRTITGWDSNILWPNGTQPTLTTDANKCDVLSFMGTTATGTTKAFGTSVLKF